MDDFLLSNDYLQQQIEQTVRYILTATSAPIDERTLRAVIGVSPISLESAFDAMETEHASIDVFIEQGLGIDPITRQILKPLLLK